MLDQVTIELGRTGVTILFVQDDERHEYGPISQRFKYLELCGRIVEFQRGDVEIAGGQRLDVMAVGAAAMNV